MPELPEVQTIVNTLAPRLRGQKIRSAKLFRDDVVRPTGTVLVDRLKLRTIVNVTRRAKRIIFELDRDEEFYIHLGMTGRLLLTEDHDLPLAKHTHLVVNVGDQQLRFVDPRRFGGIFWERSVDSDLGPEPLVMRAAALHKQLQKTRRSIKTALLDQRLVAGLGNIYVDESLHGAGIHPSTIANQVSAAQAVTLTRAIKRVLRKALKHRGSTLRDYVDAAGGKGAFQKLHAVYDRADQPCRRCDTKIVRIVMGGRSTCFCPKCQPAT